MLFQCNDALIIRIFSKFQVLMLDMTELNFDTLLYSERKVLSRSKNSPESVCR